MIIRGKYLEVNMAEGIRINKYIAQKGITSRRNADDLVSNGNVKINGITIRELGYRVMPGDLVEVNGATLTGMEKKVYIALNKPLGYVTTVKDQYDRPTVMDIVTDINERLFPVGRLDYNTTGLLILTNDGDLAYRLTHPRHEIVKTYRALISGYLSDGKIAKLRKGVDIGGFVTSEADVKLIRQMKNSTLVEIGIREGKNRQIRKMFRAVGCPVQQLERTAIGNIKLGRLLQGHYRKLKGDEIEYIQNC